MAIFTFILGAIIGFGVKEGFDRYHLFRTEEEKRAREIEELLVRWKAVEITKKI